MATKKPGWKMPVANTVTASKTLMGNQDTRHKGDSAGAQHRNRDKQIGCWVTAEQKARYSAWAEEHGMSLSRLIVEGVELRMKQD